MIWTSHSVPRHVLPGSSLHGACKTALGGQEGFKWSLSMELLADGFRASFASQVSLEREVPHQTQPTKTVRFFGAGTCNGRWDCGILGY